MPELPEVETMVRGLAPIVGRRIVGIEVRDETMLVGCRAEKLVEQVVNSQIETVSRRGKWVRIELRDSGGEIVIQPRMTGGFWLVEPPREDHVRLVIRLAGRGKPVWFCDTRRLGKIHWYSSRSEAEAAFTASQGPDALEINADELSERLARTRRGIKPTLMDQKVLAGIGNIYADEILFEARIHPEHPARDLDAEQVTRLSKVIPKVLQRAIAAEGSSFDAGYRTVLGLEGEFLAENAMYGHEGEPCPSCGAAIQKVKIAGLIGRPTYFCEACQPIPGGSASNGRNGRVG